MRKVWSIVIFDIMPFVVGLLIGLYLIGCSSPQCNGWTPTTKHEMKMLIGKTTIEVIHAYQQAMQKHYRSTQPESENDPEPLDERKY